MFTPKTRILVLNNPSNPFGKLFTQEELEFIRSVILKWPNVIVLADDVYEHMIYDNLNFKRFCTLPDMWDRTINVFSAGKTFSCTGWRVGWGIGPDHFIKMMNSFETWVNYCGSRVAQAAVANIMQKANAPYKNKPNYYRWLSNNFQHKRDRICDIIEKSDLGFKLYRPEGGYFLTTGICDGILNMPIKYFYKDAVGPSGYLESFEDWKNLKDPHYTPDMAFCLYMTHEYGFTPCPMFPFYDIKEGTKLQDYPGVNRVRFALCKRETKINLLDEEITKAKNASSYDALKSQPIL